MVHREREAARRRAASKSVREVGPLPEVVDPARRERCRASLLEFLRTYFPARFPLPFAAPHFVAIERLERCILNGGLFAVAQPRGMGKTTIAEAAALWALVCGYRSFLVLVCATAALAKRRLKSMLRELESNDLLAQDWPEVCHCIRALERVHNRTAGQTLDGEPTRIEMTAESLVLPTVPGAASSGAVVQVAGMETAVRGMNVSGPDGAPRRPDMVLIDDAQTRDSAKSLSQTIDREAIILGDLLGLAGPETAIACAMLATVIYPGDLSDRFLSPDRHPEWCGIRTQMLEAWPSNMGLWDEYDLVRRESFRAGDEGRRATEFYRERRAAMDAGAAVSWPERKRPGELFGIQSAMNLYFGNRRGFLAEYQNTPEPEGGTASAKELKPDQIAARLSGLPRYEVPREAARLTAFVDCGGGLLWYAVVVWDAGFGGTVLDYGSWPRQARSVFEASAPRPSLAEKYPGLSETQWLYAGLADLTAEVLGRTYYREGTGEQLRVERCLIDAGWQAQVVYQFCRQTPFAGIVYPSKGIGRTTTSRGISKWKPRPGEQSGHHWRLTMSETGRGRMVQFDPDAHKTVLFERLTTAMGGRGCLTFWGTRAAEHELIAAHCCAESAEPVTLRGATFDKWRVQPHRPDNHLFGALVGCCVAASVTGLRWSAAAPGEPVVASALRPKIKLSELVRERAGRRPAWQR